MSTYAGLGLAASLGLGLLTLPGCARLRKGSEQSFKPTPERELAAKQLQTGLDNHLCKAAVYPIAGADWQIERVTSLRGRGATFEMALEAMCREADGLKLPAVVDVYHWRAPSGWAPNFELRGTAVRFESGFTPPTAPDMKSIQAPGMPTTDEEPPPAGETAKKS
jgi:hypothetical protein